MPLKQYMSKTKKKRKMKYIRRKRQRRREKEATWNASKEVKAICTEGGAEDRE